MSLSAAPNFNTYINRAVDILQNSVLLFPKTVGGDNTKQDLISGVLAYRPSKPENPPALDLPYIFIQKSENGIIRQEPAGRDDEDSIGPNKYTLEIWAVIVALGKEFSESQSETMDIAAAIQTTFGKNKSWRDHTGSNPIAIDTDMVEVPFLLETTNAEMAARNVVLRPKVFVNMR